MSEVFYNSESIYLSIYLSIYQGRYGVGDSVVLGKVSQDRQSWQRVNGNLFSVSSPRVKRVQQAPRDYLEL